MSYKYKNVSEYTQSLAGYGEFAPGEELIIDAPVNNPNFQYIGEDAQEQSIVPPQDQQTETITEGVE